MKKTAALAVVLAAGSMWALAGSSSATAAAPVTVSIIKPITLKKGADLWFGRLIIQANSGALLIHQTAGDGGGDRKPDPPGVTQIAQASSLWHNAKFEVSGEPGMGFAVAVTGHPIIIQSSTHETMTVGLNYYSSDTVIDPTGSTIWVGGKLFVPNSPQPGRYSGEFEVTVAYY